MTALIHRYATGMITALVVLAAAAAGVTGWRFLMRLPLEQIVVAGNRIAPESSIVELAAVDTARTLYRQDEALIADRVERHPWVREASVLRLPTGTLRIGVDEREPAVQVIGPSGRVVWYLDREGAMMPVPDPAPDKAGIGDDPPADAVATSDAVFDPASVWFDVPVLSGLPDDYHPMHTVTSGPLVEFLGVLSDLPTDMHRMISEVILVQTAAEPDIRLRLAPTEGRPSIAVRLGSEKFRDRLDRLMVFWDKQVAVNPDVRYEQIDLRFHSQIVSREFPDPVTP